jgi:hypothetical protein
MNGKKAKAARRAQREAASMVVSVLHRATNETTESFGKRMYRAVVAQAVADGEPLSQRCVDVAETRARCWFADEPDLALGHNPPRDQRVIKFLIDTLADPNLGSGIGCRKTPPQTIILTLKTQKQRAVDDHHVAPIRPWAG